MTSISAVAPEEHRAHTRSNKHSQWRRTKEYRAALKSFLEKHPWCEIWLEVGVKVRATEAHHVNPWSYRSFELFCDLENNGAMAVSGSRSGAGHYAAHHDLKICPICKKRKCNRFAEGCQACLFEKYPDLKQRHEEGAIERQENQRNRDRIRRQKKNPHPCKWRARSQFQRCLSKKGNGHCNHNRRNASGSCPIFKEKPQKVTA